MSYSPDAVTGKLAGLNDTQESIVSISQWVMFHRRYAKQTVQTWMQCLEEATSHRKLHLIYLANEVVQQSRARKKEEFLAAFRPKIAGAVGDAYAKVSPDIRNRIKRVTGVWRQRNIFAPDVLDAVEARFSDVDKGRSAQASVAKRAAPMASLPSELTKLAQLQQELTASLSSSTIAVASALQGYAQLIGAESLPSPPVYAARLVQLLRSVDTAVEAAGGAIDKRKETITQLEGQLVVYKASLQAEQSQLEDLERKKQKTVQTQKEVEELILGSLNEQDARSTTPDGEPPSPDIEALTPPAAEGSNGTTTAPEAVEHNNFEPMDMAMYIEEDRGLDGLEVDQQFADLINNE